MAHDSTTGRIYIDTSVSPHIGVSISDVNTILAAGSLDLGTLCRSTALIQKWAKYKPMPIGTPAGYTDAQAKAINYGLYIPYYTSFRDMVFDIRRGVWDNADNYDSSKTPWANQGVAAGNWFRLLDFDGYRGRAPQPVAAVQAERTEVGLGYVPGFYVDVADYNAEYLTLADIGVTVNGTEYRGSNMYIGFVTCDGTTASTPASIYSTHNFWQQISMTTAGLNTSADRSLNFDNDFAFNRTQEPPTYNAPSCLFISSVRTGVTLDSTGVFIPIIPTRSVIGLTFEVPVITPISYDDTTSWWFDGNSDLTLIIKCYPNGIFRGKFRVAISDYNGDAWAMTDENAPMELSLPSVYDLIDGEEQQYPVYVRFSTGWDDGTRIVTATSYVVHPDTTFYDIYDGVDYSGAALVPASEDTAEITEGSILNGVSPVAANIYAAYVEYSLGTSSYGFSDWTLFDIYG